MSVSLATSNGMESEEQSDFRQQVVHVWLAREMSDTSPLQLDLRDDTGGDSKLPLDASAPSSSASSSMTDTEAEAVMHNFECSHQLDENSLRALRHDDDEDQVHRANTASYLTKQRQRQEAMKNFKSGEPCMVCGDAASGIHYSVWSCNGCKTFFRRCVIENRTYSCKRNGDCAIDKSQRCACRHCRFRKCLQVGMDCAEFNTDRRRKRRTLEAGNSSLYTDPVGIDDPLVRELIEKEHQFLKILTSTVAPIHSGVKEALSQSSFFSDYDASECTQMKRGDQMNFSYWRAKILSTVIEWAKSFDEFSSLAPQDQEAMLVHAAFSNLVLSEAFHTPERYTDRIVFPDGLSGFRNLTANILKERSGLIPTVVAVINNILVPIRKIGMNEVEYVLLQAIIFFDPECLSLSESAVEVVTKKRSALLDSLRKNLEARLPDNKMDSSYRLAALLLRISNVHKVAAFKRETLCTIETFNLMSPHPLTMEICKKYPDISFF